MKIVKEKKLISNIIDNLNISDEDTVFISGSLVEGIGNENSDIDIFIITNRELPTASSIDYEDNFVVNKFDVIDGFQCDIEIWEEKFLTRIIEKLEIIDLEDINTRTFNTLKELDKPFFDIMSLLHRIKVGYPIHNSNKFYEFKESIQWDTYFSLLQRMHTNLIDNQYEDIIGNYKAGNYTTAICIARESLVRAIMVLLVSNKVSIDREKWALLNLSILSKSNNEIKNIENEVLKLLFMSSLIKKEDYVNHCKDLIKLINNIINKSNLGG